MMSKKILTVFVSLLLMLTGCNRIEHSVNKIKKQVVSVDPASVADLYLDTENNSLQVITLLNDLYLPWALTALPDNTLLITEKNGGLYRYNPVTGERSTITGLPDSKLWGQGGLMDVIPHPAYQQNQWLYFSYAKQVADDLAALQVARGKLEGDRIKELEVLFTAQPGINSGSHFGGALVFDDRGYLFITSGERGSRPLVQSLENHIGKIIRINADGSVPADNPFVDRQGALKEIYSIGHRNPQGIGIEPKTREIWAVEHGPRGGDEVNVIKPGLNYGWPIITHGVEYASRQQIGEGGFKDGMEQPLYHYVPSIATAGMTFYQGAAFPEWQGNLLIAALSRKHINRLEISAGQIVHEERLLHELDQRIRDVAQGADGLLYVLTDLGDLLQVKPHLAEQ